MHGAATLLFPLLAAEKSRVPFYVAGGLLATWAVIVSVVLGLRHANFPGSVGGERAVLAITAALVVVTIAMAVVTSGSPAKSAESASSAAPSAAPPGAAAPTASTPAAGASSTSTRPRSTRGRGQAKATTGTPAPPSSPARSGGASSIALAADPSGLLSFNTKRRRER